MLAEAGIFLVYVHMEEIVSLLSGSTVEDVIILLQPAVLPNFLPFLPH